MDVDKREMHELREENMYLSAENEEQVEEIERLQEVIERLEIENGK